MTKQYKTIASNSFRDPYKQSNKRGSLPSSTRNQLIEDSQALINKTIIDIKFPRRNRQNIKKLPTSLYETSLKRLKQQHSNQKREGKISNKTPIKREQDSQQENLKQYKIDIANNSILPNLHSPTPTKKHYQQNSIFVDQKKSKQSYRKIYNKSVTLNDNKLSNSMEEPSFIYRNLKQKYLQVRELEQKKNKNSSLDKVYNSLIIYNQSNQSQPNQIRIDSQRKDNKKDNKNRFNGFKTVLYTNDQPLDRPHFQKKQQKQTQFQSYFLSNYTKKKELKTRQRINRFQNNITHFKNSKQRQQNNEDIDCSPWQTDLINFD